ncbi:Hypothetical predicted protein [Mytilus galloprovincialis]|uniref:Mab-21-like HhH/H2TH-like domain-containing protein n=1 Tax=Mytilus galloprovincialis TaxID=29158 RepID=A0A8B6F6P6_MYTGA|nr:Hypothetical predicted protein [Mytilus galloprovincialis]
MSDQNISEYFTKNISTNTSLLRNVWFQSNITQVRKELYSSYSQYHSVIFVNDFVKKKSSRSIDLSTKEIQRIHIQNAENSIPTSCSLSIHNIETVSCQNIETNSSQNIETDNSHNIETDSSHNIKTDSSHSMLFERNVHGYLCKEVSSKTKKMYDEQWTPDIYITDEYLERLNIPPGDQRRRLINFYSQSKILFCFLSYHIGNESIVRVRRRIIDHKYPHNKDVCGNTLLASGSKAEGLDMKGSDTDIMVIDSILKAYDGDDISNPLISCRYDSMSPDFTPGYVLVELGMRGNPYTQLSSSFVKTSISVFMQFLKSMFQMEPHGPAMSASTGGEDFDLVLCIKSITWPNIASEWVLRKRKYGWPSQEMIQNIQSQGCHLVPVSSKVDTRTTEDIEWRLSFSFAKRELVHSFRHTQLLVYGLLKLILKEVIGVHHDIADYLCSYFLKTTIFWVIEDNPQTIWNVDFLILSFHLCLERLIQFIVEENCPNYFIRINNMFLERFTPAGKEKLLALLCKIQDSGFSWIPLSSTLKKLNTFFRYPLSIQLLYCAQNLKFKKECCRLFFDLSRHAKFLMSNMLNAKQMTYFLPYVKSLMKAPVIRCSCRSHICHYLYADEKKMTHKLLHTLRKLNIHFLCKGCRADLACGKTMLASWLYNQGKFTECLQVTSFALDCAELRRFHVGTRTVSECPSKTIWTKGLKFLDNLNHYYTENITFSDKSKISVRELSRFLNCILNLLSIEDYRRRNAFMYQVCPEVYCHFLRFLCYLRQANLPHSEEEFYKMIQVHFIGSEYE